MMTKIKIGCIGMLFVMVITGCAAGVNMQAPVVGGLYANYRAPLAVGVDAMPYKVGAAECTSILGWVASGDCSITAAAKNGGIARIQHVDYEFTQILMIFATYKVIVYGE